MELKKFKNNKIQILVSVFVLSLATLLFFMLISTKPQAKKQAKMKMLPLVEAVTVNRVDAPVFIEAYGQMLPKTSLNVISEVSGKIIFTHKNFVEGGVINEGEILVRVDPREYELALAEQESFLAGAELNLAIQQAQHKVAKADFSRRSDASELKESAKALATRKHYLDKAKAEYEAALSGVKRARLALEKATVKSPINAIISSRNVNLGEFIFAQKSIANLYGTNEFIAEVSIPVSDLKHLSFSKNKNEEGGSRAMVSQISMGDEAIRRFGIVKRLLPKLGPLGHMARVIVSIKDPLGLHEKNKDHLPLLAGAKVSVKIFGNEIKGVFKVPRNALIEDNAVMIVDDQQKLQKVSLDVVRRDKDHVFAEGEELFNKRVVVQKANVIPVGQSVRLVSGNLASGK